jgi:DNA-directed RNA polymerase specialized sigma24 family protein
LGQLADPQPTPAFAIQVQEELAQRLIQLGDDLLRKVAIGKLDGFTNDELAQSMGISAHAVGRKLRRIRNIWKKEGHQ